MPLLYPPNPFSPPFAAPNTKGAFNETNTNESIEQIVATHKYGPRDSFGPSQQLYTPIHFNSNFELKV